MALIHTTPRRGRIWTEESSRTDLYDDVVDVSSYSALDVVEMNMDRKGKQKDDLRPSP